MTGPGRFDVPIDTEGLGELVVSPTTATLTVDASTRTTRVLMSMVELAGAGDDVAVEPVSVAVTLYGAEELLVRWTRLPCRFSWTPTPGS